MLGLFFIYGDVFWKIDGFSIVYSKFLGPIFFPAENSLSQNPWLLRLQSTNSKMTVQLTPRGPPPVSTCVINHAMTLRGRPKRTDERTEQLIIVLSFQGKENRLSPLWEQKSTFFRDFSSRPEVENVI